MALEKTGFRSSDGETNVTAYVWTPENGQIRGIVQIIHGMCEHMGRYSKFAETLNEHGYVAFGDDHLGHGETVQKDGTYGYFGKSDGANFLVNDCRLLTDIMKERYPDMPLFLLGHSMGSFIGRVYITKYHRGLSGFICMGTGGPNPHAKSGRTFAALLSLIGLGKKEGRLIDNMAFKNYNNRFKNDGSNRSWISRDREVQQQAADNKHVKFIFTNAGFRDMLDLNIAANSKEWFRDVPKNLPMLLVSGLDDPVGDYGKGVEQVRNGLQNAGMERLEYKLYVGARHELLNETNRDEVFVDILAWMERTRSETSDTIF